MHTTRIAALTAVSTLTMALGLVGSGGAMAQPAGTPETKAAAVIRPAIVYLETTVTASGFQAVARCTGFVVNSDGYIATAGHCVDAGYHAGDIAQASGVDTSTVLAEIDQTGISVSVLGAGQSGEDVKPIPASVLDVRPLGEGDVALLKVEAENLPSAELSDGSDPAVGTPVLAVGYPQSTDEVTDFTLEPTAKSGTISAIKSVDKAPVYEVSAAMSKGMSGGPTVDLEGRVLGVNSFAPADEEQAFNYIAPVSGLLELLAGAGVEPGLSPADASYRAGVDSYYAGDYSAAVENFDSALGLSPSYPNAFEMRTESVRQREEFGDKTSRGFQPWMFIVIGVVIVGLATAGLIYYLRTHGSGGSDAELPGGAMPAGSAPPPAPPMGGAAPPTAPAPAAGATTATMPQDTGTHCNNCGFTLSPGQTFCGRCGKSQH